MTNYIYKELDRFEMIEKLRRYYKSKDLYRKHHTHWDEEADAYEHQWHSRIKPLRNVVPRTVDFFTFKILPADIQLISTNETLKTYVSKILSDSNFNEKKKLLLTDFALLGEVFLKVNIAQDKVYFTWVDAADVTEIHEDKRGNLLDIRLEYAIEDEQTETTKNYIEYWDKNIWAIWIGDTTKGTGVELNQLGDPVAYGSTAEFGINFVPFVHCKFKDLGRLDFRGTGCVEQALDTIDEANRQASRLAQQALRDKPIYTISANSVDANNFTLSPIKQIKKVFAMSSNPTVSEQSSSWTDDIFELPAMSEVTNLISNVDWNAIEGIVDATMQELSEQLPALKYYDVKESNISTQTLSLLLDAPLSQAKEASHSFLAGIIRACQIGLTMGIFAGLFPATLGTYQNGNFNFIINSGEPFALGVQERAELLTQLKANMALETAMKLAGYSQTEIDDAVAGIQVEAQKKTTALKETLSTLNSVKA